MLALYNKLQLNDQRQKTQIQSTWTATRLTPKP